VEQDRRRFVRISIERPPGQYPARCTYAIVAIIELARKKGENPDVPGWIEDDYFQAIRELAEIGAMEVLQAESAEEVRAILAIIAITKDLRIHGELLLKYAEAELRETVPKP
jgi:hypothetical protein